MPSHEHDYEELWYLTGQHKSGFSAMYEWQIKLVRSNARLFPGQPREMLAPILTRLRPGISV